MKIVLLILIITILTSCGDCVQRIKGNIIDDKTELPVDSVMIQNQSSNKEYTFSDTAGNFELRSISGGIFRCPPMNVEISKVGYDTIRTKIGIEKPETIRMKKRINNKAE